MCAAVYTSEAVTIHLLISTDGDPEYREFPVEWFLKEVDRVEVGMETVTVVRAE